MAKNWNCVLAGSSAMVVITPARFTRAITSHELSPSGADRVPLNATSPDALIDAQVRVRGLKLSST